MPPHDDVSEAPAVKSGEVRGYLDDCVDRYTARLLKIETADELREFLGHWPYLAADAIEQAKDFTDADVAEMQRSRKVRSEGRAREAVERFGAILTPERLVTLAILSGEYKTPAGAVYIRLWEVGGHDEAMA